MASCVQQMAGLQASSQPVPRVPSGVLCVPSGVLCVLSVLRVLSVELLGTGSRLRTLTVLNQTNCAN